MASHLYLIQTEDLAGNLLPGIEMRATSLNGNWAATTNACGQKDVTLEAGAYHVDFFRAGALVGHRDWDLADPPQFPIRVGLDTGSALPNPPTRSQAIHVKTSDMQGLMVQTAAWGWLPWFGGALGWLDAADRAAVYAAKRALGDIHCIVALTGQYAEANQAYAGIPGRDYSQDLPAFRALLLEIVQAGFIPMVFLGGDGQGSGPDFNDAVGWTYGYQWLTDNFPRILAGIGADLHPYILFVPGWDSVFYGWDPSQVAAFGVLFRTHLPAGYLSIEHNTGHLPVGNGPADWAPGGAMVSYDCLLSEYDTQNLRQDSTWQIAARCLGPAYIRPPDQPAADDPPPAPWYLAPGTPRGPYAVCAFEYDTYEWVRDRVSLDNVKAHRAYLQSLGYTDVA